MQTTPLVSKQIWADRIGLPLSVLEAQIKKGYWPMITVGRRSFINVAKVNERALQENEFFTLNKKG